MKEVHQFVEYRSPQYCRIDTGQEAQHVVVGHTVDLKMGKDRSLDISAVDNPSTMPPELLPLLPPDFAFFFGP